MAFKGTIIGLGFRVLGSFQGNLVVTLRGSLIVTFRGSRCDQSVGPMGLESRISGRWEEALGFGKSV